MVEVMSVPQEDYAGQFMSGRAWPADGLRGVSRHVYQTLASEGFTVSLRMDSTSYRDGYETEWRHRLVMEASW